MKQNKIDSARIDLLEGVTYFTKNNFSKKHFHLLFVGWAHMLLDSGVVADARRQMEDILNEGKYKNPVTLWAIARANIDSKNGDAAWAIELLNKAAKRDKKNEDIYLALGDAYRKIIDGSKAITSYDKALEINPGLAEAMYKKGQIRSSFKR